MAGYKYSQDLTYSDHAGFDGAFSPGSAAPSAGVYRCVGCGDEIGIAQGHTLPPQTHHQHAPGFGKVEWQLLVEAQQRE